MDREPLCNLFNKSNRMRIIDPGLEDDFGMVEFDPLEDTTGPPDGFSVTVDGSIIGTIAPLFAEGHEPIQLDDDGSSVHIRPGVWSLELDGVVAGHSHTHILWVAEPEGKAPMLTDELAAWAVLTVMREAKSRRFARG
jgi:hypothetical protein